MRLPVDEALSVLYNAMQDVDVISTEELERADNRLRSAADSFAAEVRRRRYPASAAEYVKGAK